MQTEEVDKYETHNLCLAEDHEELEAGLTAQVGMLNAQKLLLDLVRGEEAEEPIEVESKRGVRKHL